ncbi:hypothetical protein [Spartinivicinus ruber]|uniref:hypothetical protein n=1 Tax=Spartinivicinus ruber TaxID=2683272 RepID=UPI0013D474C0|nr:hypothetical protein [Spartinivicinus ruber]
MKKNITTFFNQALQLMSTRTLIDGGIGASVALLSTFFSSSVGLSGISILSRFFLMVIAGWLIGITLGLLVDFYENSLEKIEHDNE